jgi:tripeptidyl-peptidase II
MLLNENRTFKACIDPTKLPTNAIDGSIHFGEIVGHDSTRPEAGPVFRVPVTVVKPRKVLADNSKIPTAAWTRLAASPGKLFRKFIEVPLGASWAEITVECSQFSTNRLMVLAAQSIQHPKVSTKFTLFDKYLWMQGDARKVERIDVVAGRTIELLFGQYWSSLGDDGELNVTVQFRGLTPDTQCLTLTNYEEIGRVNVRSLCNGQETLTPRAVLCAVQRPLYPTSTDLRPLSVERDGLDDGKVVYQMILSYTYQTDDAGIQIIPRVPNLSEVLYDSPFEAQFWMIHEAETKRLIGHGDAWPDWLSLPTKGKYIISVQLRHDDSSVLEKMKSFPLLLERQLPKDKSITLNVYNSHYNAISGGSKFPSAGKAVHDVGHEVSFFITAPTTGSVPAWVNKGDTLLGVLQISKVDGQTWEPADLVGSESKGVKKPLGAIKLCFAAPPKPKTAATKSSTSSSPLGLPDQLSKYIVDHISALVNQSKFDEAQKLLAKLKEESTKATPSESLLAPVIPGIFKDDSKAMKLVLAVLELKIADGTTTDPIERRKAVTAAAHEVISRIDRDALAVFFGMRRTPEETAEQGKQMEEQKKFLLDALKRKALALLGGSTPLSEDEQKMLSDAVSDIRRWVDLDSGSAEFNEVVVKYERSRNNVGAALRMLRKELGTNHSNILSKKGSEVLLELLQSLGWQHLLDAERRNQLARFPQGPLTMF